MAIIAINYNNLHKNRIDFKTYFHIFCHFIQIFLLQRLKRKLKQIFEIFRSYS
jgi:hypothetical protein